MGSSRHLYLEEMKREHGEAADFGVSPPCPECGGPADTGAGHDCEVDRDAISLARVLSSEQVRVDEVSTIYVADLDRYIVSLIVGYAKDDEVTSPRDAAYFALRLTTDEGSTDTVWRVYDRLTEKTYEFTQREMEWR